MNYTIGQIEKLTGIKAHVLRYWEEVVPSLAPLKTSGGHRLYSQRHLDLINRMNYLITKKGFTIEGARNQIISESDVYESSQSILQNLHEAKRELESLFLQLQSTGKTEPALTGEINEERR